VLDFHPGGDLATQLARWGRLGRDRTRFYSAEIAEGLTGLHEAGVIYRDLKPENVLIGADGHVVLTDFGLSKQFDRPARRSTDLTASMGPIGEGELALPTDRASWMPAGRSYSSPPESSRRDTCTTFCGTAEYLAPEVLLGEPYSYECDAWSFGTMLYEMLTGMVCSCYLCKWELMMALLRHPFGQPITRRCTGVCFTTSWSSRTTDTSMPTQRVSSEA
jgi:serum/glucocorticoid-regulated kinase 2